MGMAVGWAGGVPDSRVGAIAPISGEMSLFTDLLDDVTIPVFLLGGTLDTSVPITENDLGFSLIPDNVYQADIVGATHTHFANICSFADFLFGLGYEVADWPGLGAGGLIEPYNDTCTPGVFPIDEAIRIQNLYVVSFFKKYLMNDASYDTYLTETYALANEPDVNFKAK